MTPVMTRVIAKIVFPIILMIAIAQIMTAGSRPGEGFTAGLVTSLAVLIQYVAFGYRNSQKYLPVDKLAALAPLGLVVASLSALLPLAFGASLLSQFHATVHVPFWGDIKLATDVLMDVGVFLVVFGGLMSMLKHLKELR